MRCKLGPASFAAGMPEPSLSPMAPAGFDVPLRPLGEVEIKKVYQDSAGLLTWPTGTDLFRRGRYLGSHRRSGPKMGAIDASG